MPKKARIIGVFDSGVGGQSVARAIQKAFPNDTIMLRDDSQHVPYGTRSPEEILTFVTPIFRAMVAAGCEVIVIACNTVSTTLYEPLQQLSPVPLIAMVPMVKPAAQLTHSKKIAVCATPTTLASPRYNELKRQYAQNLTVIEPDCSDWSLLIQNNKMNAEKIAADLQPALDFGADVIVLGCTHYHWIETEISELAGNKVRILQPEEAIISQLARVLARLP